VYDPDRPDDRMLAPLTKLGQYISSAGHRACWYTELACTVLSATVTYTHSFYFLLFIYLKLIQYFDSVGWVRQKRTSGL